ncbi:hypothetical protein BH11ARM2_BH11ARM2_23790 [soil metagenome]
MAKGHITRYARSLTLATIFFSSAVGAHAQSDSTFLKGFSFSGFLDLYYQYDFGRPGTGDFNTKGGSNGLNFRQFDSSHNSFTLAALQLNAIRKPTAENPWGLTVQLSGGKVADILALTEPAGANSASKFLQQAYVTYAAKQGLTVDFGKFLTWIGYEGIQSADQDLYSRGFLFYFCQPIYHTGLRASIPIPNSPVTASAYLVNGWNEFEDSNAAKTYGASLGATFGKTSISTNYLGGNEGSAGVNGFVSGGTTNVNLGDLVLVHQLNDKIKLALNADYGTARPTDGNALASHGKFYGIAGYIRGQINPTFAAAVRYEAVNDPDGIRSGINVGTGGARFNSVAGTLDFNLSPESLLRFELRYDYSNRDAFNSSSGAGAALGGNSNRTTLTVSHTLKF